MRNPQHAHIYNWIRNLGFAISFGSIALVCCMNPSQALEEALQAQDPAQEVELLIQVTGELEQVRTYLSDLGIYAVEPSAVRGFVRAKVRTPDPHSLIQSLQQDDRVLAVQLNHPMRAE